MTALDARDLSDIDWLLEHGLGGSARTWVGCARGSEANRRLEACRSARPRAGLYVLWTAPDGSRAWCAPAALEFGLPRHADARACAALANATQAVESALDLEVHRRVRLTAEDRWLVEGESLGLAAALAYAAHLCERHPTVPVFATGRLLENGAVARVDHLLIKVRAALADLRDSAGLVLVPELAGELADSRVVAVGSWNEAVRQVFGPEPLVPSSKHTSLRVLLRSLASVDSEEALKRLDGIDEQSLRPRDRVLYLVHRGNHLRHLGRTEQAHAAHEQAAEVGRTVRLDLAAAEELELAQRNTNLDFFELDEPIAWMRARLEQSFASMKNELRLRGTLSRALAMRGDFEEALAERRLLLQLHYEDQELARELPRSLTELAWVAGLARDEDAFQQAIDGLVRARTPADAWTTHAVIRAYVLLGRDAQVAAWVDGDPVPLARPFRDAVESHSERGRGRHPVASTVRAVVRALRRSRRFDEGLALARSVMPHGEGLDAWVAWTCRLEEALALRDVGRKEEAELMLGRIRERLVASSPRASRRYSRLIDGTWDEVEEELETLYY